MPQAFVPANERPAAGVARADRREPHRAAGGAAADGRRRIRLSRLRHGAADGGFAGAAGPDPIGIPDAILVRPTLVIAFDAVEDTITVVTPVRVAGRRDRDGGARARRRAAVGHRRCARPAARQVGDRYRLGPARRHTAVQHHAGRIQAHGDARQGLHRRRRYFSGRAVAAFRGAVRAAAVCAVPRAAARQSVALSATSSISAVLPSPDRAPKSWSSAAAASSPSARSPAPRRAARPRTRIRRSKPSCLPIPRSAPSI